MKTLDSWNTSGIRLSKYLQVGDRVDNAMHDYFRDLLYPAYFDNRTLQVGEAYSHVDGKPTFTTFKKRADGRWYYCGNCHVRQTVEP